MINFISNLISGLSLGAIYALIALGYTMVYGIAKMLNFAHGDIIMVGAFATIVCVNSLGLSPVVGVLLSIVICTAVGVTVERIAYRPLRQAASFSSHNRHRCKLLFTELGTAYFRSKPKKLSEVHRYIAYQIR